MPTPSAYPAHQPASPARGEGARRRPPAKRGRDTATQNRPAAAPVTGLSLAGLQAICDPAQWDAHDQTACPDQVLPVLEALLADARLAAADPRHGSLDSRVMGALNAAFPAKDHTITLDWGEDRELYLVIHAHTDGYLHLHALDRWLADADPHLLPGLFALLERRSLHAYPVAGPRAAHELASFWYNFDSLEEILVEEGQLPGHGQTGVRPLIRLAEAGGHNHPLCVRRAYPPRFFRVKYTPQAVLRALRRCTTGQAMSRGKQAVWRRLVLHTSELLHLPEVTLQPNRAGLMDGTLYAALLTTLEEEYCPAVEVVDEYFQMSMQVGEDQPCNALHLTSEGASLTLDRLETLLATHAAVTGVLVALDELNGLL